MHANHIPFKGMSVGTTRATMTTAPKSISRKGHPPWGNRAIYPACTACQANPVSHVTPLPA